MTETGGKLISVDGITASALKTTARSVAARNRHDRAGISLWGASGIFDELTYSDPDAGRPSPRTLLLLYAADLEFRLRWQIRPALEEGRTVVAAPYVVTAIALGRAVGLDVAWLHQLFQFAPEPEERRVIDPAPARRIADRKGFVEFAAQRLEMRFGGLTRLQLLDRTRRHLRAAARQKALR